MRIASIALLALALSLVACSEEDPGSNRHDLGEGGSGGDGGAGGTGGLGGIGGIAGSGGMGGVGGIGGVGGSVSPPCDPAVMDGEACQGCISSAILVCGISAGCGDGLIALGLCAAEAGCSVEDGIDPICASINCPEESLAVATCLAQCAELRACAGM